MIAREYAAIICTYNRARQVEILLRTLTNQTYLPGHICIVDSYNSNIPNSWNQPIEILIEKGVLVKFINSKKGLSLQRNIGIDYCLTKTIEYLCFFDDDIILPNLYVEKNIEAFSQNPKIIGAAGIPKLLKKKSRFSKLDALMKLDSFEPGRVTKSGINTIFDERKESYFVDWLPGCCMSFRASIFADMRFDNTFGFWGEDVNFSMSVGKKGELVVFSIENLLHTRNGDNRDAEIKRFIMQFISRIKLSRRFPDSVSLVWVTITTAYLILLRSGNILKRSLLHSDKLISSFIFKFVSIKRFIISSFFKSKPFNSNSINNSPRRS